ncbi:alpha/beta hydrolase [Pandoraea commovens]|uniref:Alpha/beta hydrolase n=1 Tax=Pandoraea commovens TaxID=2508289 RepID=A0A5E4TIM8_9BURK|nr:alpha/beta hydrolase [Pandoraea commovens]UVA79378.1 alpha/beta hydrolase [Pandoraea commovens]VVD86384.1 Carboxylesterase NlhH [Pandoraea commovens]
MTIDADLLAYYDLMARKYPTPENAPAPTPQEVRAKFATVAVEALRPLPAGLRSETFDIPLPGRNLRARLYRPVGRTVPLVVYFHGGGWVVGDVDTHGTVAALLAQDADVAVLSVDYRLAPEHPFPTPIDDAREALAWAAEQRARLGVSLDRLAVAGDSAGGHLAAQAAAWFNDKHPGMVGAQLLIYPVVQYRFDTPSYERLADGVGLTRDEMRWYWKEFLGDVEPAEDDVRVNLMAEAPRHPLPNSLVIAAEYDPLHDEAVEYARFVARTGARAEIIEAAGLTHSFARLQPFVPQARMVMHDAAQRLREWLG